MNRFVFLLAPLLTAGCAFLPGQGGARDTVTVEASAEVPLAGKTMDQAKRQAKAAAEERSIAELLEVYLSSGDLSRSSAMIQEKILDHAPDFIKTAKVLDAGPKGDAFLSRIKAEILYVKLAASIDALPQDSEEGLTRVVVSLSEEALNHPSDPGRASSALRRALIRRGFSVIDLSDGMTVKFKGLGSESETMQAARKFGAQVIVCGSARSIPVADARLEGYSRYRAEVSARHSTSTSGGWMAPLTAEATAVDLDTEGALTKALEDAGELLGERLIEELGTATPVRFHMTLSVSGLEGLGKIKAFLSDLRRIPQVRQASLQGLAAAGARLRVTAFTRADEVAAALMRLRRYTFRALSVEDDLIEMELD